MKSSHGLSIAALIAALAVTPAIADQPAGKPASDKSHQPPGQAGAAGFSHAAPGHQAEAIKTFDGFLAALKNGQLGGTPDDAGKVTSVQVVEMPVAFADFDRRALSAIMSANETQIQALRQALSSDEQMKNLLIGNNVSPSHIVGIESRQDGTLIIYTDGHS